MKITNTVKLSKNSLKIFAIMSSLLIATPVFADNTCKPNCNDPERPCSVVEKTKDFVSNLFCKAKQKTSELTTTSPGLANPISLDQLKGNLVKLQNGAFSKASILQTSLDYYVVYCSAHWCGPCRQFTPELIQFYNSIPNDKRNFEVIFVSFDESEPKMLEYMQNAGKVGNTPLQMPWYAVKYDVKDNLDLLKHYKVNGIPALFIFNKNGELVSHSSSAQDALKELKSFANTAKN